MPLWVCVLNYLITHSQDDKAAAYLEKIIKILRKEKYLKIEKRAMNIWDLFVS
jgi:hypothetical protein